MGLELLLIFAFKILDTSLGSLKNIFMIKNKNFLSALANAASYIFYILLFKKLMASNDPLSIAITCLAIFIGQYMTQVITNKFDKDLVWKVNITAHSKEDAKSIADALKEFNIPVLTFPCYNINKEMTLGVTAYSETKKQSIIINNVLQNYQNVKFNIVEIKNRF